MRGNADEARDLALAQLVERFHDLFFFDLGQIFGSLEAVQVEQVHPVDAQAPEAFVGCAHHVVRRTGLGLGGHEKPFAAAFDGFTDPGFALAPAIRLGRVDVIDSAAQRQVERLDALVLLFVHRQATAAAYGQDGSLESRFA